MNRLEIKADDGHIMVSLEETVIRDKQYVAVKFDEWYPGYRCCLDKEQAALMADMLNKFVNA